MVQDTRETPGTGAIKPVDAPVAIKVRTNTEGELSEVRLGRWVKICTVQDNWRIDDEWWRSRPISRIYYRIVLQNGFELTIYRDLVMGSWYQQSYE